MLDLIMNLEACELIKITVEIHLFFNPLHFLMSSFLQPISLSSNLDNSFDFSFNTESDLEYKNEKYVFNFLIENKFDLVLPYFVYIRRQRNAYVYYGYDASSFVIVKSLENLQINKRYILYGKLQKGKFYYLESIKKNDIDFNKLLNKLII
ncbi:hypothetical protein NUSPORA_01465 [Nucleospora cyclopteri]